MGPGGRNGKFRLVTLPLASIQWQFARKAGGTLRRPVHIRGLVSRWPVDVLQLECRRRLSHLAPAVPQWTTRADYVRTDRRGRYWDGLRWPLVCDGDRHQPKYRLDQ